MHVCWTLPNSDCFAEYQACRCNNALWNQTPYPTTETSPTSSCFGFPLGILIGWVPLHYKINVRQWLFSLHFLLNYQWKNIHNTSWYHLSHSGFVCQHFSSDGTSAVHLLPFALPFWLFLSFSWSCLSSLSILSVVISKKARRKQVFFPNVKWSKNQWIMKLKGNLCALTYSWSPYRGILFHLPNELNVTLSLLPYSHCMVAGSKAFLTEERRREE